MTTTMANTSFVKDKPFSDTVKALLLYTKDSNAVLSLDSVKVCLGEIYHPEMALDDVIVVLCSATRELVTEPRFKTPSPTYLIPKIVKAPIQGTSSLGDRIFGPSKEEKFTVEEFYNSMIVELLNQFRFSTVDWCSEYLFPKNEG